MKVYRGFDDPALKSRRRCVAVGIFDGVHRAHAKILKRVVARAKVLRAKAMAVTFHPHPEKVLSGGRSGVAVIQSLEHRLKLFTRLGLDETLVVPFTKKTAAIAASDFLDRLLLQRLGAVMLGVGHDFRFGQRAQGDAAMMRASSKVRGFELFVCPPVKLRGQIISSTLIRREIESGRLVSAGAMLGRPVSVYGTVTAGRGRGRGLGYPTANIDPHHEALPPQGVYAAYAVTSGKKMDAVVHLGPRPTFGEKDPSVEAHFLDRAGDWLGRDVELFFVKKLRPIRRFRTTDQLKVAILQDIRGARKLLKGA